MMKVCVAGVGAVGTTIAARLAAAARTSTPSHGNTSAHSHTAAQVHLLARGSRLEQLRRDGLCLALPDASIDVAVPVSDRPDFGIQDIVFIATKAHGLAELLPTLEPLIGPETLVAPLVNGIPWWYFQGIEGRFAGDAVAAVDPSGQLRAQLAPQRILGCVVYLTARLLPSGRVHVMGRQRVVVGALRPGRCARADALADLLSSAGIDCVASADIRSELWTKVALNLATNPLSVVTEATLQEQFNDPNLLPMVTAVIEETLRVGRGYGAEFTMSLPQMVETGRKAGAFETSMLQDYRAGRPLELAAIAHGVLELARKIGEAMPTTQLIVDLCAHRAAGRTRKPS
jgi:2-dehydropantoate 2-reductase